jgi:EmrB/QacA subfamily drug resistance transporter
MAVPPTVESSSVPDRAHRLLILGICSMSLLIVGLDATIVNVALPAIHRSLHASVSGLQWTIDAYTLVLASLLMVSGSTADRIGRRRVFQIGLATFSLGSLLCALAPTQQVQIGARILQAIGGSMLNPVAMSIIRNVFTDPRERAQAIGVWGAMIGLSIALGPVLGGVLVDTVSWRAVFLVNLPVGLAAILLTARYVPESRAEHTRRIDPVGQLLIIIGLASLVYAIIEAPSAGWLSAQTLSLGAVSVIALTALVGYERRTTEPLIEMRFFGSAPFAGASGIAIAAFAVQGGFLFLNTLYLQEARGLSPLDAGLCTLPMALGLLVITPLSGRYVGNRGARAPLVIGALLVIVAGVMLTRITDATSYPYLFAAYAVLGLGMGSLNPPITNTAVSGMPASMAGVAAAIASTGRQFGSTLGVAVLGALAGGVATGTVGRGFAAATHVSWWIVVGLGVVMLVLGFLTTSSWALGTARRTADSFDRDVGDVRDAEPGAGAPAPEAELVAH